MFCTRIHREPHRSNLMVHISAPPHIKLLEILVFIALVYLCNWLITAYGLISHTSTCISNSMEISHFRNSIQDRCIATNFAHVMCGNHIHKNVGVVDAIFPSNLKREMLVKLTSELFYLHNCSYSKIHCILIRISGGRIDYQSALYQAIALRRSGADLVHRRICASFGCSELNMLF